MAQQLADTALTSSDLRTKGGRALEPGGREARLGATLPVQGHWARGGGGACGRAPHCALCAVLPSHPACTLGAVGSTVLRSGRLRFSESCQAGACKPGRACRGNTDTKPWDHSPLHPSPARPPSHSYRRGPPLHVAPAVHAHPRACCQACAPSRGNPVPPQGSYSTLRTRGSGAPLCLAAAVYAHCSRPSSHSPCQRSGGNW